MTNRRKPDAHVQFASRSGVSPGPDADLFQLAVRHMHVGVIVHGLEGEVLCSNAAARSMLGLTADELHGRDADDPAWHVVDEHGGRIDVDQLPFVRCLRSENPVTDVVIGVRRLDGELSWLRLNATPLRDRDRNLSAVLLEMIDVTKERCVATELVRSLHQLDLVRHAAGVGLWEWNVETGALWWDDAFRAVMGSAGTPAGLRRLLSSDDTDEVAAALASPSGQARWTCRSRSGGATRWIAVTAEVTTGCEGRPIRIGGSVMDISDVHNVTLQVHDLSLIHI